VPLAEDEELEMKGAKVSHIIGGGSGLGFRLCNAKPLAEDEELEIELARVRCVLDGCSREKRGPR
jgi:hypothetical protein